MLLRSLFLISLLSALPVWAEVGTVTLVEGEVQLIRGSELFLAEEGVALEQEDILETGRGGRAQLEMVDGTLLDLGPESTLHLVRYRVNQEQAVESSEVSLLKGWLRFVTGLLQRDSDVSYTTPVVTLGIKGTQGVIAVDGGYHDLTLEEGVADVSLYDEQGGRLQRETLRVGQQFEYRGGYRGRLYGRLQARFANRYPNHFHQAMKRRLQQLKQRGKRPKRLRAIDYDDIKQLLKISPKVRRELSQRFSKRLEDPKFRREVQRNLARHPEWRERVERDYWKQRRKAAKQQREKRK